MMKRLRLIKKRWMFLRENRRYFREWPGSRNLLMSKYDHVYGVRNKAMKALLMKADQLAILDRPTTPPKHASFVTMLLPLELRVLVIGDLEEQYDQVLRQFGPLKTKFWYWQQVILAVVTAVWQKLHLWETWARVIQVTAIGLAIKLLPIVTALAASLILRLIRFAFH